MVVSLGCGARVWEEAHRETNSLCAYVGNVEAAAAGLVSCVQELEHLLTLSSIVKSGHDNIDVVTGRIATAATREVQKPAAQAAQAVAAAWEATMELGEVRRETHALRKAQWEEIKHLNLEAAETQMLYEVSRTKIQDLTDQSQKLTQNLEQQSSKLEELEKTHQAELALLQKKHKMMKAVAKERGSQNMELKKANEISKNHNTEF
ncbi:hypothetical protein CY35_07G031500 [Sphagnum magellanicum]|uniref:Uncharacterized protein n=1 Tax=Sphagnum magellanicum TaxID=128215 RepID=A0ACB8HL77_9BRYO|nr:hypothetical protein CY35_07G031500 [Sphagnum magellanicum]